MKKTFLLCLITLLVCAGCQATSCCPSRPLIGITSVYKPPKDNFAASTLVDFAYVKAIAENDGAPLVLPTIDNDEILDRYLEDLDGLLLVGGADIPPSAYGREPHQTVRVMTSQRYDFERKLISRWLATGKPLLGVCLGMQFTNVVSGGTLIQDIPSQVGTKVNHRAYHRVNIQPGSILAQLLEAEHARVYSNHHQAVRDLGKNLKVIARSEDGVIEALQRTDGPFGLFVQWHPEKGNDMEQRDAVYGSFIWACNARK